MANHLYNIMRILCYRESNDKKNNYLHFKKCKIE